MNQELKSWCEKAEELRVKLSDEYFRMQVGLKYSEKEIHKFEEESKKLVEEFLKNFNEPKQLYYSCVESLAGSKTYKLMLKLHELRKTKISTKKYSSGGKPLCWTSWRQWACTAEDKARKEVYDEFISKVPAISPAIKERFDTAKKIIAAYGTDPLKNYLYQHKMPLQKLKEVIEELRAAVKPVFEKKFSYYTKKAFGREPRYYDDFYVMRNVIYNDMIPHFKKVKPLVEVKKTMEKLGISTEGVKVDDVSRPNKYPSPFMEAIQVPNDIRVSFKAENPLNDTNSIYHEFGHAVHYKHINAKLPYWVRYDCSEGLAETFSTFFEMLISNKLFLEKEFGIKKEIAEQIVERNNFSELYAIAFYTGNSEFKIDYWDKNISFEKADTHYAKCIKNSMGINIPGAYWQLHHILPESLMYVPSYMLAKINAHSLHSKLAEKYGEMWWREKKAGEEIKSWMKPGAYSPTGNFSKIDSKQFVKEIKNWN